MNKKAADENKQLKDQLSNQCVQKEHQYDVTQNICDLRDKLDEMREEMKVMKQSLGSLATSSDIQMLQH